MSKTTPDPEELRKLSPATAYQLAKIIEEAGASRKEDHAIMERLASDIRGDLQSALAENMRAIITLTEGLRTDVRCQSERIDGIEGRVDRIAEDVRRIKQHLGVAM